MKNSNAENVFMLKSKLRWIESRLRRRLNVIMREKWRCSTKLRKMPGSKKRMRRICVWGRSNWPRGIGSEWTLEKNKIKPESKTHLKNDLIRKEKYRQLKMPPSKQPGTKWCYSRKERTRPWNKEMNSRELVRPKENLWSRKPEKKQSSWKKFFTSRKKLSVRKRTECFRTWQLPTKDKLN